MENVSSSSPWNETHISLGGVDITRWKASLSLLQLEWVWREVLVPRAGLGKDKWLQVTFKPSATTFLWHCFIVERLLFFVSSRISNTVLCWLQTLLWHLTHGDTLSWGSMTSIVKRYVIVIRERCDLFLYANADPASDLKLQPEF